MWFAPIVLLLQMAANSICTQVLATDNVPETDSLQQAEASISVKTATQAVINVK